MPVNRYEAFEFKKGGSINAREYTYNGVGALVSDANRGIAHIEYDNLNYPREIQFTNGHIIRYVYAPDGTKLRTTRITAMENVIVPLNTTLTLQPAQILSQDSTEYFGNVVLENGIAAKYLYNGGYATLNNNTHEYALHYYTKDHLGNNRVVVNEDGTVEQTTHYYPFGGVFADAGTNAALQPYKYNGKELDRTHGLDSYDYGARQYYAPLLTWDRVDPLCEKYYHISPYAYCGNNPVSYIDERGDSIMALIAPNGANGLGHMGILIQNENNTWSLWSKNGTEENLGLWGNEGALGSEKHNNRGGDKFGNPIEYSTINEFFNDENANPLKEGIPEYTGGYIIPTDKNQDRKARIAALLELKKKYNVFTSNCAQTVQAALKAAGQKPGYGLMPNNSVYPSIIRSNKAGIKVHYYDNVNHRFYKLRKD